MNVSSAAMADVLPPDKGGQEAPFTTALRELLRQIQSASRESRVEGRVSIELDRTSWKLLRHQYERPYRPEPAEMRIALEEFPGVSVWVKPEREYSISTGEPVITISGTGGPFACPWCSTVYEVVPEQACHVCGEKTTG